LLLILTGFLLMPFYQPGTPKEAIGSVVTIEEAVAYGSFIRSLHFLTGQLMVVTLVGHTLRVLISGAFAPPRQGNWLIGMGLLLLTFFLDFSGYLLIGDERAMDASRVAFGLFGEVPLFGKIFQTLLFGADPVGYGAGLRLYTLHCGVLPFFALGLCAWHFYRIRRDGGVSQGL
jgi:quinol-cytochrome oxidoreductase complex cytochrome b subunit